MFWKSSLLDLFRPMFLSYTFFCIHWGKYKQNTVVTGSPNSFIFRVQLLWITPTFCFHEMTQYQTWVTLYIWSLFITYHTHRIYICSKYILSMYSTFYFPFFIWFPLAILYSFQKSLFQEAVLDSCGSWRLNLHLLSYSRSSRCLSTWYIPNTPPNHSPRLHLRPLNFLIWSNVKFLRVHY